MEMLATLLLVLLCTASTSLFPSPAAGSPPAVLDVDGQSLRQGQRYYVLPAFRGMGGGLAVGARSDMCPLYVVQAAHEVDPGHPVSFTPVNPHDEVVCTSTDLNVQVSAITICMQSNVWRLGGIEGHTGHRYVAINGVKGNPGKETMSSWFKIEKYGETGGFYKFVFCPAVCETCKSVCRDLGVFIEENKRWLGITGDRPFAVQFRPAAYRRNHVDHEDS